MLPPQTQLDATISRDKAAIASIVRNYIQRFADISHHADEEDLLELGIVNSLFSIQLMTFMERTFRIKVHLDDLDIKNFSSVRAIATFVSRKQEKTADAQISLSEPASAAG